MTNETLKLDEQANGQLSGGHLFDYLYILVKRRKFILTTVFGVGIIAAALSLLMPNWYAATASVLPPKRPGGLLSLLEGTGFSSILRNLPGVGGRLGGGQDTYSYLAILHSRMAMEKVVRRFDLMEAYDIQDSSMEKALRALRNNAEFDFATEGNITITVFDKEPQRAAAMANYFVELLNELSVQLGTQEARNNREFIERRYLQNQRELKNAEDSLKVFQQRYGIYALPEQTAGAVKAAGELKAEAVAKEIELGIMRRSFGAENPRTQALQMALSELNKKLDEMKYGDADWRNDQSLSLFVPFKDVPEIGVEYIRRYRDFEIQNRMMEFLVPLYEQAKIDEQKDTPVVLVLDSAVPPERKARPRRSLYVLVFMALAGMFSTTWVFVREIYNREKERNGKVSAITEELKRGVFYRKVVRRIKKFSSVS
ncbi:Wzz/FepE/Etk N-terminal domain-containing protein [candidate division KSB1 bacterium]|nr:Wzz/FepE/Etk N-terminal domain-containing protein [candidate division KSB1 bacterium]